MIILSTDPSFWRKTSLDKITGCVNWLGPKIPTGYGCLWKNKIKYYSHRYAFIITKGSIPEGMLVCHKCDNRLCCNPEHLFLGTYADNSKDMCSKNRQNKPKGELQSNSKLIELKVKQIRALYPFLKMEYLAHAFEVSVSCISKIILRKDWSHIPVLSIEESEELKSQWLTQQTFRPNTLVSENSANITT